MKNALLICAALLIALTIVMKVTEDDDSGSELSRTMCVWSCSDELKAMAKNYYSKQFPDRPYVYTEVPVDNYPLKIDLALMAKDSIPDVFTLEDSFLGRYTTSKMLLDITDIYQEVKDDTIPYTAAIGMYDGKCYALSWQVCPGAVFYRRSLAKKYLGTDDPEQVQLYMKDIAAFMQTAALLKNKSAGTCAITASYSDLFHAFETIRTEPWESSDEFIVDKQMMNYMHTAEALRSGRYDAGIMSGTDEWFAAMNGSITREDGSNIEVFSYFMPVWGYKKWLKTYATATAGDWAMIPGPVPYRWGGTWLAANARAQFPNEARQFIRYMISDKNFLMRWALDSGDIVSNKSVLRQLSESPAASLNDPFLSGQNAYNEFAKIAASIDSTHIMGSHQIADGIWQETVNSYINGKIPREEALSAFKDRIMQDYGVEPIFR